MLSRCILKVLLAVVLAASSRPSLAAEQASIGTMAALVGQVTIQRDAESLIPQEAEEIFEGDVVSTGHDSSAKMLFVDDSVLTIGAGTSITIDRYFLDADSLSRVSVIKLLKGKLRSLVSRMFSGKAASFEVRTGSAVAGVRGTEFAVEEAGGGCRVFTFDGAVEVRGRASAEPVLVGSGQMLAVDVRGVAAGIMAASGDLLSKVRSETDVSEKPKAVAFKVEASPFEELPGLGGMIGGAGAAPQAEQVGQQEGAGLQTGGIGTSETQGAGPPFRGAPGTGEPVIAYPGGFENDASGHEGSRWEPTDGSAGNSRIHLRIRFVRKR